MKSAQPLSPPAIWAAFARQGAWKDWVIVALLALNGLLVIVGARLARRDPDIVLVSPEGKSTYLPRELAGDALARFLAEQRQLPGDVTILHFTDAFLRLAFAINSTTVEGAWGDALSLMTVELRAKFADEAKEQKLVERYKLARVRTELAVEELQVLERTSTLLHVRAVVARKKATLAAEDLPTFDDRLRVELVERIVPRSVARPDGLEVAGMTVAVLASSSTVRSSP